MGGRPVNDFVKGFKSQFPDSRGLGEIVGAACIVIPTMAVGAVGGVALFAVIRLATGF